MSSATDQLDVRNQVSEEEWRTRVDLAACIDEAAKLHKETLKLEPEDLATIRAAWSGSVT